jgi:Fur family ferric uptake transcriptional regulator
MDRIGQRQTAQRQAIQEAILTASRPLTASEILTEAGGSLPGLGIATVYRTVNLLVEAGWLKSVQLPGEPSRFEPADGGHHHFFQCTACGLTFPVAGCAGALEALVPDGFQVEGHEIVLYGTCQGCSRS